MIKHLTPRESVLIQTTLLIALLGIGIYGTIVLALIPFIQHLPETLEVVFSYFPFSERLPTLYSLRYHVTALFDILISILVFFYAFHITLDFKSRLRETRYRTKEASVYFQRFSLNQRLQHVALITTFTLCAITGFALQYYNSWGSTVIAIMGGPDVRRMIHLGSGFTMGVLAIYHGLYYGYHYFKKGRKPLPIMISKRDLLDLVTNIKYFLHIGEKPRFGRYDYIQKFDYWGVYWGMIILGIPGVLLWYLSLPAGAYAAAEDPRFVLAWVFHEREALLAGVTLFVWHFYYAHLNPHAFPMSRVWITGKISEEEMIRDHPLEYEEITLRVHSRMAYKPTFKTIQADG